MSKYKRKPTEKLRRPCPFCGNDNMMVRGRKLLIAVECQTCDGRTGYKRTLEDALVAWNFGV